jgi:uncharacterized delta-60 repeat protein
MDRRTGEEIRWFPSENLQKTSVTSDVAFLLSASHLSGQGENMNRSNALKFSGGSLPRTNKKIRRSRTSSARLALAVHERLETRQLLSGAPILTIAGSANTSEGADYSLSLSSSNLGSLSINHWTIDWGDGQSTVSGSASTADHFYADGPNTYTIDASATLSDNSVVQANLGASTVVSNGALDPSFGTAGKVVTSFPGTSGTSNSVALLDDGQSVVAGAVGNNVELIRYNADGSIDNTFNGGAGSIIIPSTPISTPTVTNVLDENIPDPSNPGSTVEKILVVGNINSSLANNFRTVLWRFNADGTVDNTFGTAGVDQVPNNYITAQGFADPGNNVTDATIDPTGQIVLVGQAWGGPSFQQNGQWIIVTRLNSTDGSVDTTFNGNGEQAQPIGTSDNFRTGATATPLSVVSGPDQSVIALAFGAPTGTFQDVLMKFTPTGQVDTTFGSSGVVNVNPVTASFDTATLDGNGNILLGGQYFNNPAFLAVERVSYATGAPDTTFGSSDPNNASPFPGMEATFISHVGGGIVSLGTMANGQIVALGRIFNDGGFTPVTGNSDLEVVRYDSNGTLDTTFGTNGLTQIDFEGGNDTPASLAVQADSRILVAGFSDSGPGTNDSFSLARLGEVESSTSVPVTVFVANVPPTITILNAPAAPIAEGSSVSLSSSVFDPGTLDTAAGFSYSWSATKNGVLFATGGGPGDANFGFTTNDNGTYVVTVTATDKDNGVSLPATATFTAFNVAPTPTITTPVSAGSEGTAISLSGSATDPSTVDTTAGLALSWSVTKNGSAFGTTGTGPSYTFTPDDNGTYVVTLSATDKDGGVGTTTDTINVINVPPTATINSPVSSGSEGTAISLTGSATDPSTADTSAGLILSWSVTKNGSAFGTTGTGMSYTFTPDDNGTYVVTLTATDKDHGAGTATDTINVINIPPTAKITAPVSAGTEGTAITLNGSATDPSTADTAAGLALAWSVTKNGSAFGTPGTGSSYTFTPNDNGTYVVTLTATDKDHGVGTTTDTINVANVAPTVAAITAPAADVRYETATFASSFTDPGPLDTHTVAWNFGDTSTSTSSLAAGVTGAVTSSHVYTVAGTYTVTLTITDKDGGTGTVTKSFTVDVADMQPDPNNAAKTALFVGGTSGGDLILVTTGSHSTVQVQLNSTTLTGFTPTGRIVVYGGDGDDTIEVASNITLPTELYGGNGNDLIKGGGGSNIIVGGTGDDLLDGGGNRDLLFGGGGNDLLVGGSNNDLLVAMPTQWDANPTALEAIQNEWLRTDISFSQQVTHLTQGGGLNGSFILNGSTTTNDNATDLLIGGSGSDLFVVDNGDIVLDATHSDDVVDLSWVTI